MHTILVCLFSLLLLVLPNFIIIETNCSLIRLWKIFLIRHEGALIHTSSVKNLVILLVWFYRLQDLTQFDIDIIWKLWHEPQTWWWVIIYIKFRKFLPRDLKVVKTRMHSCYKLLIPRSYSHGFKFHKSRISLNFHTRLLCPFLELIKILEELIFPAFLPHKFLR